MHIQTWALLWAWGSEEPIILPPGQERQPLWGGTPWGGGQGRLLGPTRVRAGAIGEYGVLSKWGYPWSMSSPLRAALLGIPLPPTPAEVQAAGGPES